MKKKKKKKGGAIVRKKLRWIDEMFIYVHQGRFSSATVYFYVPNIGNC